MSKKYLLLCTRHSSLYGDEWALFWGNRESKSGYTCDPRVAHRFDEEEIKKYQDSDEIAIPIDALGLQEGYENEKTINKHLRVLIEKGTLNDLLELNLRPQIKKQKNYSKGK